MTTESLIASMRTLIRDMKSVGPPNAFIDSYVTGVEDCIVIARENERRVRVAMDTPFAKAIKSGRISLKDQVAETREEERRQFSMLKEARSLLDEFSPGKIHPINRSGTYALDMGTIADLSTCFSLIDKYIKCNSSPNLAEYTKVTDYSRGATLTDAHLRPKTRDVSSEISYIDEMLEKHADRADMFQPETQVIETRWVRLMRSPEPVSIDVQKAAKYLAVYDGYENPSVNDIRRACICADTWGLKYVD